MSSGVELLILAPLLIPALLTSGGAATAGVAAAGSVGATGGVTVTGSSIVTTSAFSTGSIATGGAAGGSVSGVATGAAALGGAVLVVGAAGAALLAAHQLHKSYRAALDEYNQRVESEQAEFREINLIHQKETSQALFQARKTRVHATESAEITFLLAGTRKLQRRLGDWPDVEPTLPDACSKLIATLEKPDQDLKLLFAEYESLGAAVADWAAKKRTESIQKSVGTSTLERGDFEQGIAIGISELRDEIYNAPPHILSDQQRGKLKQSLEQVEHLKATQPRMAEQSLRLLRSRVSRELTLGAELYVRKRQEQEKYSARLRELSGHISARAQATLTALDNEELINNGLASSIVATLQAKALVQLKQLSSLVAGELPANLAPLESLAHEADKLFEATGDQLRQLALQIYLEAQVTEVFTELGYRVSTIEGSSADEAGMVATLDRTHGIEVRLDRDGILASELVALSPSNAAIDPEIQEKACSVMDDVIDALKRRGCGVREKKRRHYKLGERSLRVVKTSRKKEAPFVQRNAPNARRIGD
jgi:hypothetical protein